jgi:RND family efflux transporter MFP subunit
LVVALSAGCATEQGAEGKKEAPAKLEHPDEGDIYRIVLTPKAEARLQIRTVPVARHEVQRSRTVGGSIVIADGAAVQVTAPVMGALQNPSDGVTPSAGQRVSANQTVFRLSPLLAPEREVPSAAERVAMANARASLVSSQIIADGEVQQGESQVEAAEIALDRARRLFADKVGSQRDVDDAVARRDIAQKALQAARERKEQLDQLTLDEESEQASDVPVLAPHDGILRNVTSSVGQVVSVGAPLFEVVNLETMWVRAAVYPGLSAQVDRQRNAIIRKLGQDSAEVQVTPIAAPPSGDSLATSVDIFFELSNEAGQFSPGEPVEVILPLVGETESRVVPRAAILRDIHGIAWVYVNSTEHEFRRQRAEVEFTTDEWAVLSEGPEVGSLVVTDGVAELFGTEFGAGK